MSNNKKLKAEISKVGKSNLSSLKGDSLENKSLLIITHRDLDGLISAFLLFISLKHVYKNVDVLFSQPCLCDDLHNLISNKLYSFYNDIALLDLSVDYVNPAATKDLFNLLYPKLKYLFDHHAGWDKFISNKVKNDFIISIDKKLINNISAENKYIILDIKALCCAELIFNFFNLHTKNNKYLKDILAVARIADDLTVRRIMEKTKLYRTFVKLKNKTIEKALQELLRSNNTSDFRHTKKDWHLKHKLDAMRILKEDVKEVYPEIGYLCIFDDSVVEYTSLCEMAYKKYKILIIKELNSKKLRLSFTIGHTIPNLDLTKVFSLKGGNPRRVTLYQEGITIKYLIDTLKSFL